MRYYRITEKQNERNTIAPQFPSATTIWSESTPILIPGKVKNSQKEFVFLPFYESHTFMISDDIRKIWVKYQSGGRYRPCVLGELEQKIIEVYWLMMPGLLDAIHENTKYKKNGDIEKLCLDTEIVKVHKVFGIRQWHQIILIVTEDILENMLQQEITEFAWEEIECS